MRIFHSLMRPVMGVSFWLAKNNVYIIKYSLDKVVERKIHLNP